MNCCICFVVFNDEEAVILAKVPVVDDKALVGCCRIVHVSVHGIRSEVTRPGWCIHDCTGVRTFDGRSTFLTQGDGFVVM